MSNQNINKKLEELARSYTPQWQFDAKRPDIGAVIALLFAEQMDWNRKLYGRQMEEFHAEFIDMLGISLLPARPACAVEIFEPNPDLDTGTFLKKGTKLLSGGESEDIVFETVSGLYVTDARITHILEADAGSGLLFPVRGKFREQSYFDPQEDEEESAPQEEDEAFALFSFPEHGIEKNALILRHKNIFGDGEDTIYLKFPGRGRLAERIEAGEFSVSFLQGNERLPVREAQLVGNTLVLRGVQREKKEENESPGECAVLIEAAAPVRRSVTAEDILISSAGENHPAAFAGDGTIDRDVKQFAMFGDTLQLFSECYIGDDHYFSRGNALVRIAFDLSYMVHLVGSAPEAEDTDLRIIKRKPRVHVGTAAAETRAEEIAVEYYNGTGWKRLIAEQNYTGMFADGEARRAELSFLCPKDWHPVQIGGYEGRALRFRILKADNCYLTPCSHVYPVLKNLEISYSYEGKFERPGQAEALWGTRRTDVTRLLGNGQGTALFEPPAHRQNTLYLGLDKAPKHGPVSFYAKLDAPGSLNRRKLKFEYSSISGFKPMKVLDGTRGFSQSGIVSFFPPDDMRMTEVEGAKRCWIRITETAEDQGFLPVVRALSMNAVEAANIVTGDEEDFYLDSARPNMEFALAPGNILDAEVWVSERELYSEEEMRALLKEEPERTRASYNFLGEIEEFYVLWDETESFLRAPKGARCYILDRMRAVLRFGDGIHVRIPQTTGDCAFKARLRRCDGAAGNVGAHTITSFAANTEFNGTLYNPRPAYGGSNIEEPENALLRGAALLSGRNRLVTRTDYIREIRAFSSQIDKAACVVGQSVSGEKKEDIISLVLLMKDYGENSGSFARELPGLKDHLMSRCEMTVPPEKLEITEPVPVAVSVEVWVKPEREEESFELQAALERELAVFLNPVSDGRRAGWEIGTLPGRSQILMKLNAAAGGSLIKNVMITGACAEKNRRWERELDKIAVSPFYICTSGKHRIHIVT